MAQTIIATFQDGVLRPTQPLDLPEHAQVRITIEPWQPPSLTIDKLNAFLRNLPSLADDADLFAKDVRAIRAEFPAEASPWD